VECPACGAKMESFETQCPRCARAMSNRERPVNVPRYEPVNAYAQSEPMPGEASLFGLKQIVAFLGALLLIAGAFISTIQVPQSSGISLIQLGHAANTVDPFGALVMSGDGGLAATMLILKFAGYAFVLLAIAAIIATLARATGWIKFAGSMALVISSIIVLNYFIQLSRLDSLLHDPASPLKDLIKESLFSVFPLGWGVVLLLIGAVVLLTAAALPE